MKSLKPPACILSGGETTVALQGRGKGGRNNSYPGTMPILFFEALSDLFKTGPALIQP